jgi:hypothetical protein
VRTNVGVVTRGSVRVHRVRPANSPSSPGPAFRGACTNVVLVPRGAVLPRRCNTSMNEPTPRRAAANDALFKSTYTAPQITPSRRRRTRACSTTWRSWVARWRRRGRAAWWRRARPLSCRRKAEAERGAKQGLTLVHILLAQPEPVFVIEATASVHFPAHSELFCHLNTQPQPSKSAHDKLKSGGVQRCSPPRVLTLNSGSGLVSKLWYRSPLDQSVLSKAKIRPRRPAEIRHGRDS